MQKKIIALALAGFASSAVFAQTNVTIYGQFDLGQAWVKSSARSNNPDQPLVGRLDPNNSYMGFRGMEDLGDGMKALWQYESNIQLDNGGAVQGGRDMYVGLTGSFGTLRAGRLTLPARSMGIRADFVISYTGIGTTNSLTGKIHNSNGQGDNGLDNRVSNAIVYSSPSFNSFTATVAYGNGEVRRDVSGATNNVNSRTWQIAGVYENGPIYAGLAYNKMTDMSNPAAQGMEDVPGIDYHVWRAVAVYTAPFGTQFSGLYDHTKVDNITFTGTGAGKMDAKRNAWSLSALHPINAHAIGLQYARAGETNFSNHSTNFHGGSGSFKDKASIWTALYQYTLSKRTLIHARYTVLSNGKEGNYNFFNYPIANGVTGTEGAKYSGFMIGLRHKF